MSDLEMDKRFDTETEQSTVDEGTAFRVAPTNGYNVQLEMYEQTVGDDKTRPFEYDRAITTFRCPITVLGAGDREMRLGSAMVTVSHETKRLENGDLDKLSKRYAQLVKALQDIEALPKAGTVRSAAVWEAAVTYPIHVFATESFKIPSSVTTSGWTYVTVRRPEDNEKIAEFKNQGWGAKNFVQAISRYRQDA